MKNVSNLENAFIFVTMMSTSDLIVSFWRAIPITYLVVKGRIS